MTHQNLLLRRDDAKSPPLYGRWWMRLVCFVLLLAAGAPRAWADTSYETARSKIYGYKGAITHTRPYFEFQYPALDTHGDDDAMREIKIIARTFETNGNKSVSNEFQIGYMPRCNDKLQCLNTWLGRLTIERTFMDGEIRIAVVRFYPSKDVIRRQLITGLRFEGIWDIDDDNKGDPVQKVDIPWNDGYSTYGAEALGIDLGTFNRSAPGKVTYTTNESKSAKYGFVPYFTFNGDGLDRKYGIMNSTTARTYDLQNITSNRDSYTVKVRTEWNRNIKVSKGSSYDAAEDANSDVEQSFYSVEYTRVIPGLPYVTNLIAQYNQWTKKVELTWDYKTNGKYSASSYDKWVVYRYKKGAEASSAELLTRVDFKTKKCLVDAPDYETDYVYVVSFLKNGWSNQIVDDLKAIVDVNTTRDLNLRLTAVGGDKSITLNWTYSAFSDTNKNFEIYSMSSSNRVWKLVNRVPHDDASAKSGTYTITELANSCEDYRFQVKLTAIDKTFVSNESTTSVKGATEITDFSATRGTYSNSVKLSWNVYLVGENAMRYVVARRILGSDGEWSNIHSVTGAAENYVYDDVNVAPGLYYEYKVTAYRTCNGTTVVSNEMITDGFCQSTGTISGRIAYGTGTAVEDVKVNLVQSSGDDAAKSQFYSLRVDDIGGVYLPQESTEKLMKEGKPFTLQAWVRLDKSILVPGVGRVADPMLFDFEDNFSLYFNAWYDDGLTWCVNLKVPNAPDIVPRTSPHMTGQRLVPDKYYFISASYDGDKTYTCRVIDEDGKVSVASVSAYEMKPEQDDNYLTVATPKTGNGDYNFNGYIDEVRFWKKELSEKEVLSTYDHLLSGDEKDLFAYWPLDEGIENQRIAYDYSRTGGIPNGNHGLIQPSNKCSTFTPAERAFSVYGRTDAEGNYVIKGVPFSGSGTNYSVVPSMGVHSFTPQKLSRFVSQSSLNHSGVDFEDTSSFEVNGQVYYKGTNIPVEGCNFYVDGNICYREGEPIVSRQDGTFTISVPIGDHFIQVKKQGHEFSNNGRFPADPNGVGLLTTFDKPVSNLRFTDSTLVVVAGRVVGGEVEAAKPLGLKQSKATIGKAEIKLTAGDTYHFNKYINQKDGQLYNDSVKRVFDNATGNINCHASAGVGTEEGSVLTITTDSLTGEFAVLLPPVTYRLESVKIPSQPDIVISTGNVLNVNASNPLAEQTDSVVYDDGSIDRFSYNASLMLTHRVEPTLEVKQKGSGNAFGDATFNYVSIADPKGETVRLYEQDKDGNVTYNKNIGKPIFTQQRTYTFTLDGYEKYYNLDVKGKPDTTRVPLQNSIVTITNEFASGQAVYIQGDDDGKLIPDSLKSNQLQLDSLGHAEYTFMAGLPNIKDDYTLGLNIMYDVSGAQKSWSQNGKFRAIVLGELPTGTNFVTQGPDKILMVLRDPPGSNSSSYYESSTTTTEKTSYAGSFVTSNEATTLTKFGYHGATFVGVGAGIIIESSAKAELTAGAEVNVDITDSKETSTTTTTTTRFSTSANEEFVGADGDVFVGKSTNMTFGNVRSVDIRKGDNGFKVSQDDALSTGLSFSTTFSYTQSDIENDHIPALEKLRNDLLRFYKDDITENLTDSVVYVSCVRPDGYGFGTNNNDKSVWQNSAAKDDAYEGPSYKMLLPKRRLEDDGKPRVFQDKVRWCNEQIKLWQNALANNEKAKIDAKANSENLITNYSFGGGTTIESSVATSTMREDQTTEEFEVLAVVGVGTGVDISGTGVDVTLKTTTGTRQTFSQTSSTENTKALGYTLQEDGGDDALSVDVYNAPDGFGPIFITRGGQTSCPYEGACVSKYYQPGTEISAATMQIEVPRISVENNYTTDVPSGGTAHFTLVMQNDSETNTDQWFQLVIADDTNPNGANLRIDGQSIGNGRVFLVPADGTLRKRLQLTQSDESVLSFDGIGLVLRSQCQSNPNTITGIISDTVYISAHFVPTCSDIRLNIPQRVVNKSTGSKLQMTVSDYDRNYSSFRGFRIQYKGEHDVDWRLAQEFINDKDYKGSDKLPITGATTSYVLDMSNTALFPDQTYLLRAITICDYGKGEVNNESEEIQVVKDIAQPRILGNPSPAGGVLTADGEISVTFNEDIKASQLTAVDNFIITGKLNGYKVDHEVAMQLNGGSGAQTEADIDLSKRSFTFNMWVKPTAAGELLSHGTSTSKLRLLIDGDGKIEADVAGQRALATNPLPMDKWSFLSVSYTYNENGGLLNGDFASDSKDMRLFTDVMMPVYEGNGPLTVGSGMKGAVHELTMWNKALSYAEAKDTKDVAKQASTPYLIGYWKMDEGIGTEIVDAARSRNMHTENPSWYLATENKALRLDGNSSYAAIDMTECSPLTTDDYALELWFRAEQKQAAEGATIFSTSDDGVRMDMNADGTLELYSGADSRKAGARSYLDQQWHHMALNVLSDGTAALYVDGATLLQFTPEQPLKMQSDQLTLGALRKAETYGAADYKYSRFFCGQLDELRLWKARMTKDAILDRYTQRLDTAVAAPAAYYPFEKVQLDEFLQPVVSTDLTDHNPKSRKAAALFGNAVIGDEAPGLKPAPREEKVGFSFTASERKVVIQLNEAPSAIEGTTLKFTLRDVRDMNNNFSDPIVWTAYVQQNQLKWAERELAVTKQADETAVLDVEMLNNSSQTEAWMVSNLPTWLQADNQSGQLNPLSTGRLRLTVPQSVALGRYEQTIYLTGNKGVSEPLTVRLNVTGEKPDWQADGSKATFTMSLIGSLEMEGRLADDEADLVAAFAADGSCVGVASPKYIKRYDSHFVLMTIYGNAQTSGKPVTFRAWDASTGKIHPVVKTSQQIVMRGDAVYGAIEQPVVLEATDAVEQKWQMAEGWQWMSFYVDPIEKGVASVYAPVSEWVEMLKGHDAFAVPAADGSWKGALNDIDTRQMYMISLTQPAELSVSGELIDTQLAPVTLEKGWNWIGYTPSYVASPSYALAAADPQAGDMVKSQHGFAIFQGYEWIGSFDAMQPGVGYMYLSRQDQKRTFCYPLAAPKRLPMRRVTADRESAFPAVDRNAYPNNMTVIARLTDGGAPVEGAEVAVFAGDECRGVSEEIDGLYFITVSGEGSGELMTVKVADRGQVHELKQNIVYSDNAMLGTLDSPYLLDISETVGIASVENQGVSVMPRRVKTHVTVSAGAHPLAAITINSMSGHIVYANQHPSPDMERIDLQSVPQGIYFVTVTTSDGRQTTVKVTK